MTTLLVLKESFQKIYAEHSRYIKWAIQFVFGLLLFGIINSNIGFMKSLSSFVCVLGLSAVCAFLPEGVTVFAAMGLILAHLYALSLSVAAVAFAVFLLMYIFYFRFTPGKCWYLLVTPVACALKVPFVIPVAFGLLSTPLSAVPAAAGAVIYYMLRFIKMSSSAYKAADAKELVVELSSLVKQISADREMWIMAAAMCVSLLIVYILRRKPFAHSWRIASVSGAFASVIIATAGNIKFDMRMSYISILLGGAAAVAAGFLLELLFFAVNYSAAEYLQFEDNEYYYYVKAVPKLDVSAPQLSVKHINKRRENPGKPEETRAASGGGKAKGGSAAMGETIVVNTREIRDAASENKGDFLKKWRVVPHAMARKVAGVSSEEKPPRGTDRSRGGRRQ